MDVSHCCAQCSHQAVWKFQLDKHIQRKHEIEPARPFHAVTEPEQYACYSCNFQTCFKLSQIEHCLTQHGEHTNIDHSSREKLLPSYLCDKCKRNVHSSLYLAKHSCKMTRKVVSSPTKDSNTFRRCAKCSDKTKCKTHLRTHVEKVTTWLNVAKLKTYLEQHMGKHTDTFDCTECSFRTKLKASLRRHMLNHARPDQIKWFSCAKCSYRAKAKTTLKRHLLTHGAGDDDWFSCTKCNYRTIRKGYLKTHMKKHADDDDVDWLSCPECSYRAKHPFSMKNHKLNWHGSGDEIKTWFVCAVCPFRTVHKISLKRHLITQHKCAVDVAAVQIKGAAGAAVTCGEVKAVALEKIDAAVVPDKPTASAANQIKTGRRPREPDTSLVLRAAFVAMAEAGKSISEIARTFGKARACVRYWIKRGKEGGVDSLTTKTAGRGRPRITTRAEDEALVEMASEQPFFTATAIQEQAAVPCSAWTIRRRLREAKKAK